MNQSLPGFFDSPKRIALTIAVLVVVWIGSGVLIGGDDQEKSAAPDDRIPTRVKVARLEAESKMRTVMLFGATQAARKINLVAEASGQVVEIVAEEGALLADGDPIVRLDPNERAERLAEAQAALEQRELEAKAARRLGKSGFRGEVQQAEAVANLKRARAELKAAQLALEHKTVIAPFDGIVDEIYVEVGDFITSSGGGFKGEPVATFIANDVMQVVAQASENDAGHIQEGAQAEVALTTGEVLPATITFVSSVADPVTRTFRVEATLPPLERRVNDGITAEIRIPLEPTQAYLVSPSVLSLNDAGIIGVKTLNAQERVEFHPVKMIDDTTDGIWIGGLADSITLITLGHAFVSVGEKVEAVAATP